MTTIDCTVKHLNACPNPGTSCMDCDYCSIDGKPPKGSAPLGQTEFDLLAAKDLAKACNVHLSKICTCSGAYRRRKKQDPSCEYCDVGKFLLPLADKILSS